MKLGNWNGTSKWKRHQGVKASRREENEGANRRRGEWEKIVMPVMQVFQWKRLAELAELAEHFFAISFAEASVLKDSFGGQRKLLSAKPAEH